jgi:hypothetical protein
MFLFPDTRHLTPDTLRFGAWKMIFWNAPPLHHSSRLLQGGKSIEPPQGAVQSQILWARILYIILQLVMIKTR